MKRLFAIALLVLLDLGVHCGEASAERRLFTNTSHVEDVFVGRQGIWVATRGGLERYHRDTLARDRLFTSEDGLASNHVLEVREDGDVVQATTAEATCTLAGPRFSCASAPARPVALPAQAARLYQGARETRRLSFGAGTLVATAGQGLWWHPLTGAARRLTPSEPICGNHVMAVTSWAGRAWFGSFDGGLCSAPLANLRDPATAFTLANLPARYINDLLATANGLFVATGEGLFVTRDGVTFSHVAAVAADAVNDLALDHVHHAVYATTPAALWRVPLPEARGIHARPKAWWQPGGSHSLQAVDVGPNGHVWLASEDRGVLRMGKHGFEVFDRLAGLPTSWALDVAVDERGGALVASLRDGALHVLPRAGGAEVTALSSVAEPWLLHASRGPSGALWLGSQAGVFVAKPSQKSRFAVIADTPHPSVHAVAETAAGVLIASEGGVLLVASVRDVDLVWRP